MMFSTLTSSSRNMCGRTVNHILRFNSTQSGKRVALILSGNGVYDGTECTEGVAALVHLSRAGAQVQCYAPDVLQMHAIDHTKGAPHENNRNVLQESARLARGCVKPLNELDIATIDAIVLPGGFGAAKNLSNWATDGVGATLNEDVKRVIVGAHAAKKPIGACCIAPTLLALALKDVPGGVLLTVGSGDTTKPEQWPYAGTAGQIRELGAVHVEVGIDGCITDEANLLVTAPAYMYEGRPHEVFDSVGRMVDGVLKLA
jgi:enhancing lycopene biosynthesis protein 2